MCLSLEAKIDQFRLEEEGEVPERPVELSNSEAEFDRFSAAYSPRLVVARIDTSSEEEEEMALNPRRSLKNLVVGRNKGLSSKEAPKTQLPPNPSLPLSACTSIQTCKRRRGRRRRSREGRLPHRKA